MTLSPSLVIGVSAAYLGLLFAVAFVAERTEDQGGRSIAQHPLIYPLALSVYCTSWTFFGAVGWAEARGLEYIAIYLGPTLVFVGWVLLLRKLARITTLHHITSIADFISSRYGKSAAISALATVIAVLSATPYIALQLKAVSTSFEAVTGRAGVGGALGDTALWTAAAMAAFTVLFGARRLNADRRRPGMIAAIAVEAIVKLLALGAVAFFAAQAMLGETGSFTALAARPEVAHTLSLPEASGGRWLTLITLSALAIICLPRQFHIGLVELPREEHLNTAAWGFPLYLLLMCLFVIPIAISGAMLAPAGADPDYYVVLMPLAREESGLALLAFVGGLAASTSMVVVASIALAIMISNHLVAPRLLKIQGLGDGPGRVPRALLLARRLSILAIFALAYGYYTLIEPTNALASIGLISFAGVAQLAPALIGGVFWRGATRSGALSGMAVGAGLWAVLMVAPALLGPERLPTYAPTGADPLVFAVALSLGGNVVMFIAASLFGRAAPMESLQGALFVDVWQRPLFDDPMGRSAGAEDLYRLVERVLGPEQAHDSFSAYVAAQGGVGFTPEPDGRLIAYVERLIAGTVGAATAQALVAQVSVGEPVSTAAVFALLDETQQAIRHSQALEKKSGELRHALEELRRANEQLRRHDQMKDDFLSRVSHELRTPMTSIRSFAEILVTEEDLDPQRARRFTRIIDREAQRLTRLLDEILDLGRLESGRVEWPLGPVDANAVMRDAVEAMRGLAERRGVAIDEPDADAPVWVHAEPDRLKQVFVNLLSNAIKFNDDPAPRVRIALTPEGGRLMIDVADNGPGVPEADHDLIFTKFSRGWRAADDDGGSGLGLVISRQIARVFGGDITLREASAEGSIFRVALPLSEPPAALGEAAQ